MILSSLPAHNVGRKTLISHGSTNRGQAKDRARGRIVATGGIDAEGRVAWDETESSVSGELPELAA